MVTKNEAFPSKFLKAHDLEDGPVVAKIKIVTFEAMKGFSGVEEKKAVCYFASKLKPLILNRTNWESLEDIAGTPDADKWPGIAAECFGTTTDLRGKTTACVRIRKPGEKPKVKAKAPPPSNDMDDEIPY